MIETNLFRCFIPALRNTLRRFVALSLVFVSVFAIGPTAPLFAQVAAAPMMLHITILDGEDSLNNIRERTAREPIVQVEDENHKPVAGALLLFSIQNGGHRSRWYLQRPLYPLSHHRLRRQGRRSRTQNPTEARALTPSPSRPPLVLSLPLQLSIRATSSVPAEVPAPSVPAAPPAVPAAPVAPATPAGPSHGAASYHFGRSLFHAHKDRPPRNPPHP